MRWKGIVIGAMLAAALVAPAAAQSQSSIAAMVYEVCATEGCLVSPETMLRVIDCETGGTWSHASVGPNGELGILQIDPRYWAAAYGSEYEQIEFAAAHMGGDVYWACL